MRSIIGFQSLTLVILKVYFGLMHNIAKIFDNYLKPLLDGYDIISIKVPSWTR